MHQIDGLCFLVFAERGLWNRFVPSLDGYIQDRLNNPVHVPQHGTVKALRLEAPPAELVRRVVEARLRPALDELPDSATCRRHLPVHRRAGERIARTEPTLRDMLQQFRHLFDHIVYGERRRRDRAATADGRRRTADRRRSRTDAAAAESTDARVEPSSSPTTADGEVDGRRRDRPAGRRAASATCDRRCRAERSPASPLESLAELWDQEQRAARRKLEPEGALTGATRELQAGLGAFLQVCHEHGVKVGPWRLQHVVARVDLRRAPDLRRRHDRPLGLQGRPAVEGRHRPVPGPRRRQAEGPGNQARRRWRSSRRCIDHLILLRPEDDLALTGKSKTLWQDAERRGRHARLEPVSAGRLRACCTASRAGWRP